MVGDHVKEYQQNVNSFFLYIVDTSGDWESDTVLKAQGL